MELGPVSRKTELASWPSQEQLEVTQGPPGPFLLLPTPLTPGRLPGLPPGVVPRALCCWVPSGATSAGEHHPSGCGLSPGSGTQAMLAPWLFQALLQQPRGTPRACLDTATLAGMICPGACPCPFPLGTGIG